MSFTAVMENAELKLKTFRDALKTLFAGLSDEALGFVAGALALILLISFFLLFRTLKRKGKNRFPGLALNTFQIAPLGRDAFLKLYNPAGPVTLSGLSIHGRQDIAVKSYLAGHHLETGKAYSLLLEATGATRLDENFSLDITYIDEAGNAYRQTFQLDQNLALKPRLVRQT